MRKRKQNALKCLPMLQDSFSIQIRLNTMNFAAYSQQNSKADAMDKRIKQGLIVATIVVGMTLVAVAFFYFRYIYPAQTHEIILTENGFEPASITIKRFDMVKFSTVTSKDFWPASNLHPLHDIYPAFDSKIPIKPNKSWNFRFTKVGSWEYHDHLFPTRQGTIIVLL